MTIERLTASLADRYRIERTVGQGGMATVYLAQDLKHHRPVAIKVLKPELAAVIGADRFVQEITTTAQLQHPHILPLFDSGQADGFLYYVMPYIEGETLRDKLTRETQLAIDESLRITTEVADALDYAHRHGVVHRDIKPENILLHDGRPMVADFGIALALSAAAGGRMTETGMSLGTPHYMSPEQATADKEITGKSDIYSLGTVLYEMLTGSPPHVGSSARQVVMKILTEDAPPVATLRRSVPPNVAAAVATALEKLPADRFESAQAFARALADPAYHRERLAAGAPPGSARPNRRLTLGLSAAIAVVTLLAAWALVRPRPAAAVSRYGLALPPPAAFDPTGYVIITPDGSRIVYTAPAALHGQWQLWMKARERTDPVPIPETEAATAAAISPDGQWLAFVQGDSLRKTPLAGGSAVTLVPSGVSSAGGELVWLADGTLVYAGTGMQRLLRVAAAGGPATTVWTSDSLEAFDLGALTGSHLLVSLCPVPCGRFVNLWAIDLRDHSARQLVAGAGKGYYLGDGRLAFVREDGAVVVMPFDPGALTVRGAAVVVADSVAWGDVVQPTLAIAAGGRTMVMQPSTTGPERPYDLVWVDRSGRVTPLDTAWTFQVTQFAADEGMALSPDGTRLLIGLHTQAGDGIWVKQLPRGAVSRVSFDTDVAYRPHWAPDPRAVTYVSTHGVLLRRTDGSGSDSLLLGGTYDEAQYSPDGRWIVFRRGAAGPVSGGRDIYGVRPGVDTAPLPLIVTPYDEMAFAISPDGRWIAYQSDETGQLEVFVRPFPNTGTGKWQVSSGGGRGPLWSRTGRELFYVGGDSSMMALPVPPGATFTPGTPHRLFRLPPGLLHSLDARYYTPWDVAPDGRFIMTRAVASGQARSAPLVVVENWMAEVSAKLKP